MKRLSIIALSLATALASALPAEAFPTMAAAPDVEAQQAQLVRYRGYYGGYHGGYYGGHGGYYHHHGGDGWGWALGGLAAGAIIGGMLAQPGYYGSGYYGSGYYDPGYYGGYSGPYYYGSTRYYARRYYYPRTYYYPRAYYGGNDHVRWCFARYRSYRAYDNTFQPYYGPRQACVSPQY